MGRSSIQRFEDLKTWQAARELVKGIYRATKSQALKNDRGLVDQMTRAAVSITSNIAEGHERGSRVEYVQFCFYAKGSLGELRSQITNAHDVELIDDKAYEWLHDKCEEVSRLLAGYIKHLCETTNSIPGMKHTRQVDRNWNNWDEWLADHGIRRLKDGRCAKIESKAESDNARKWERGNAKGFCTDKGTKDRRSDRNGDRSNE